MILQPAPATTIDRTGASRAVRRLGWVALGWSAFAVVQMVLTLLTWRTMAFPPIVALQAIRFAICWTLMTPAIWGWLRLLDAVAARLGDLRARVAVVAGGHLLGITIAAAIDTATRRLVVLAMHDKPPLGFAVTMLYFADLTSVAYLAVLILRRALEVQDLLTGEARRELLLRTQVAQARREFLEAQLRPHFLFNSLGTISELCYEAPAAAARMLRQLASLLRFALAGQPRTVTLGEELAALEPYLDIQRVRFSDWLVIDQCVSAEAISVTVPRLTLQPLVENAIRHGLAGRTERGHILISADVRDDLLHVTVRDNGAGLRGDARIGGYGLGLANIRGRLGTLYGDAYRLTLSAAAGGGAIAEVAIPRALPEPQAPAPPGDAAARSRVALAGTLAWMRAHPVVTVCAGWLLWGAVWLQQSIVFMMTRGEWSSSMLPSMIWEHFLLVLLWALLTPVVFRIARLVPVQGRGRLFPLVHLPLAVLCSLGQITIWHTIVHGRSAAWSYGYMTTLLWNVMVYACLIGVAHQQRLGDWLRERQTAAARLEAEIAEARLRATTFHSQPERVLRALEALADDVLVDPSGTERALAQLADQLRRSLEDSLTPETSLVSHP